MARHGGPTIFFLRKCESQTPLILRCVSEHCKMRLANLLDHVLVRIYFEWYPIWSCNLKTDEMAASDDEFVPFQTFSRTFISRFVLFLVPPFFRFRFFISSPPPFPFVHFHLLFSPRCASLLPKLIIRSQCFSSAVVHPQFPPLSLQWGNPGRTLSDW